MMLTPINFSGEVPPVAQLPAILGMYPKPRRGRKRRGRFLHYPEERPGVKLFLSEGYSALCLGRC